MSDQPAKGAKQTLKHLSMRLMRPGLSSVHERLGEIERRIVKLHGAVDQNSADRLKYDSELEYWRYLVKRGGAEKDFGEPFDVVFARWMRRRLERLGKFLGLPAIGQPGDIDEWCRARSVVEIGAGPYPAVAAAAQGWKRCVAVDPIARGYVEEELVPPSCGHVVYIEAPGERIPLPNGFADLVICENCLDHVTDPVSVLREIERLLVPGGHLWIFVDLSEHQDHMHPHPMSEAKMRTLLSRFELMRVEVSAHKAHPEAYGGFRALARKPEQVRTRAVMADAGAMMAERLPRSVSKDRAAKKAETAPEHKGDPEIHVNGSVLDRVVPRV